MGSTQGLSSWMSMIVRYTKICVDLKKPTRNLIVGWLSTYTKVASIEQLCNCFDVLTFCDLGTPIDCWVCPHMIVFVSTVFIPQLVNAFLLLFEAELHLRFVETINDEHILETICKSEQITAWLCHAEVISLQELSKDASTVQHIQMQPHF